MKILRALSKMASAAIGLSVFVAATIAYFVTSIDPVTGTVTDGLGRMLHEPPALARLILTDERRWAGLWWHLADIVWFFGGIWLSFTLFNWGENAKSGTTKARN